jgi:hypothetical protein
MLARLANDTGGRVTTNSSDMTLGFARAQRDLGCQYAIGVYLSNELEDAPQQVAIRVTRPGLRAIHPSQFMFRSASQKRETQVSAAFLAPGMFPTGYLRTHVFALQPRTKGEWDTLVAISFPVTFEGAESVTVDFGAVLSRGSDVAHVFNRRVTLKEAKPGASRERRFMFLEPVPLKPGDYELRIVMINASSEAGPAALAGRHTVPPITKGKPMLVQPILGQPRERNVVVRGDGPMGSRRGVDPGLLARYDIVATRGSFEPLLVQRMEDLERILVRNKACLVGKKSAPSAQIERAVTSDGDASFELPSVPLVLRSENKVRCQNVFEALPQDEVEQGGYLFETTITDKPTRSGAHESLRFAVDSSETVKKVAEPD